MTNDHATRVEYHLQRILTKLFTACDEILNAELECVQPPSDLAGDEALRETLGKAFRLLLDSEANLAEAIRTLQNHGE